VELLTNQRLRLFTYEETPPLYEETTRADATSLNTTLMPTNLLSWRNSQNTTELFDCKFFWWKEREESATSLHRYVIKLQNRSTLTKNKQFNLVAAAVVIVVDCITLLTFHPSER
jgi:hypothetical protein